MFDPDDERYLSQLIDYVSSDYNNYSYLKSNSIEMAKKFDNKVVIEKMEKIYNEVIG